jgi:hypothetical protein
VTKLALPTANPTTLLPRIMSATVDERAWIRAPRMKRRDARRIMGRRPRASLRRPEGADARSAKSEVEDVMRDLETVVRGAEERSLPMETRVEEITPVLESY